MRRSKPLPQQEFFPGLTDVAEIGAGSLATVYRAREIGTDRLVAVKVLNVAGASPRALESFDRELLAVGAVSSHPNIVTLYRSFRAPDERPVLVLELCRGSFGDHLHRGAGSPVAEVVAHGIKIAGALETAHRAGILHQDVKPQNILLTESGEPALADLGVAMLQSSTQTAAGLFDFTTLHAAPELLEGGDPSAATDVYELASTLYQLIAGRPAFRAYDGESPASVILRILRDPVRPLTSTQAPAALSDLLRRAMSKDIGSRPPTAVEFAAGLAAVEVEQQWPRTPSTVGGDSVIHDAGGGSTGLPAISGWSTPTVIRAAADVEPVPADEVWSAVSIIRVEPDRSQDQPEVETPPQDQAPLPFVPWRGALAEPDPFDTGEHHLDPARLAAAPAADDPPAQYPIPPSGMPDDGVTGTVPTWAFRAATQPQAGPVSYGALDPMSLTSRVTLRSGTASMVVDDAGLSMRVRMRKSSIPWAEVLGFESCLDEGGRDARLVALTPSGPVELAATRRPAAEVPYVQVLLEAYRQRAAILGRG